MSVRVFISRDSGALCVGADQVARALFKAIEKRGLEVQIVRTGSRGMYWLEPTIEVERSGGPHRLWAGEATGHRQPARCRHARRRQASLYLGLVENIPFLQGADPPHLQELRHYRSSLARRLQGAWRLRGLGQSHRGRAGGCRRRGDQFRPARPRWRRLSDRHQMEDRGLDPAAAEIHRLQRR